MIGTGFAIWAVPGLLGVAIPVVGMGRMGPEPARVEAVAEAAPALAPTATPPRSQKRAGPWYDPTDRNKALHLLKRATFGPRPDDIEEVLELGIEGWVARQLHPASIDDERVEDAIADRFPAATMSTADLLERYPPNHFMQALRKVARDSTASEAERREAQQVLRASNPGQILQQMSGARLTRAAHSERQLEEMMTEFWFDHFNVDFRKNQVRWLASDYESEAIRPNVFGSFYDLLFATASHPAMLVYLDNVQSVAPQADLRTGPTSRPGVNGRVGQQPPMRRSLLDRGRSRPSLGARARMREASQRRERGLNENYARELLELHTLGVDGGYTQEDVMEVARAFTGWGMTPPSFDRADMRRMAASEPTSVGEVMELMEGASYEGAFEFRFRSQLHDPSDKVVLGEEISGSRGMEDALEVLVFLATHPSTARHIATQLSTRFVADDPPKELVDELTRVFLDTEGDLREVTRTLFTSPHFYSPDVVGIKVKSPFTLVASTVRATDAEITAMRPIGQALESLGERPYLAEAPIGYPETSAEWVSGGAMLNRMDFGQHFASGKIQGVRLSGTLVDTFDWMADDSIERLADRLVPGVDTSELVSAVREILNDESHDKERDAFVRAIGLVLGSPDFQMH